MQPAESEVAERESPSELRERPWLFNFLIAPMAVMSMGLNGGALSYLFRHEGVEPRAAPALLRFSPCRTPSTFFGARSPIFSFTGEPGSCWLPPRPPLRNSQPFISPASHRRGPSD